MDYVSNKIRNFFIINSNYTAQLYPFTSISLITLHQVIKNQFLSHTYLVNLGQVHALPSAFPDRLKVDRVTHSKKVVLVELAIDIIYLRVNHKKTFLADTTSSTEWEGSPINKIEQRDDTANPNELDAISINQLLYRLGFEIMLSNSGAARSINMSRLKFAFIRVLQLYKANQFVNPLATAPHKKCTCSINKPLCTTTPQTCLLFFKLLSFFYIFISLPNKIEPYHLHNQVIIYLQIIQY